MISFFCTKCHKDFDADARTHVNGVYNLDTGVFEEHRDEKRKEWYIGKCPCGKECMRYITDKHLDPYFHQSLKLQAQRKEFENDLIQYGDARFESLYKDQWNKFEQQREEHEMTQKNKKKMFENQRKEFIHEDERKLFGRLEEKMV